MSDQRAVFPPSDHYAYPAFVRLMRMEGEAQDVEKYTTWIMGELIGGRMPTDKAQSLVAWTRAQAGAPDEAWSVQARLGLT